MNDHLWFAPILLCLVACEPDAGAGTKTASAKAAKKASAPFDAKALHAKVEKKLQGAEALTLQLGGEMSSGSKRKLKVEVLVKAGDRLRITTTFIRPDGSKSTMRNVSNGARSIGITNGKRSPVMRAETGTTLFYQSLPTRGGYSAMFLASRGMGAPGKAPSLEKDFKVTDLKGQGRETIKGVDAAKLTFTIMMFGKKKASCTLWVDTDKVLPVQTKTTITEGGRKFLIIEQYESISTAAIDDAEFEFSSADDGD